jgi:hypothetical protein
MASIGTTGKERGQWWLAVKGYVFLISMVAIRNAGYEHGSWGLAVKDFFVLLWRQA